MDNVSPEFILCFPQMRSFSAFYVSITPNLAQEEEELGAEQGQSLASRPRPSPRKLMLGGGDTIGFAERFLLHTDPVLDVSQVAEILLDSHQMLPRLLPLFDKLEVMNIELKTRTTDFAWLEGKLFSKLKPSSLSTLRKMQIDLQDESKTTHFPPFGGFVSELSPVIGSLVALEEVELMMSISHRPGFKLPAKWMELEQVLETSHRRGVLSRRLRKLDVQVSHCNLVSDFQYPGADQDDSDARRKWGELFEGYRWCKDNLDFTTTVTISRRLG
ncbi:hypothetical protein BKA70DRAFT_460070 [Coprinopsis sp. MPI-PUGE-AT-0042]|nr:hypothetical protein BKA70DRAFT_460070 [Coprinopsis sp. MPI-PUGE-AT-0042]